MTYIELVKAVANDIEIAFISYGLTPVFGSFGDGINTGCAVTALSKNSSLKRDHGNKHFDVIAAKALQEKYSLGHFSTEVVHGIVSGFDCWPGDEIFDACSDIVGRKTFTLKFRHAKEFIGFQLLSDPKAWIDDTFKLSRKLKETGILIGMLVRLRLSRKIKKNAYMDKNKERKLEDSNSNRIKEDSDCCCV